jgi:hypothetical protein
MGRASVRLREFAKAHREMKLAKRPRFRAQTRRQRADREREQQQQKDEPAPREKIALH